MNKNLYEIAKEYAELMDRIEKTGDLQLAQSLEEKRTVLHGMFVDMLNEQGIKFKDKDHATRIAIRIANGEL